MVEKSCVFENCSRDSPADLTLDQTVNVVLVCFMRYFCIITVIFPDFVHRPTLPDSYLSTVAPNHVWQRAIVFWQWYALEIEVICVSKPTSQILTGQLYHCTNARTTEASWRVRYFYSVICRQRLNI